MSWTNSDGLYVKFGAEEVAVSRGGEYATDVAGDVVFEFSVNYTDLATATPTILGDLGTETGSFGVRIPKGLFVKEVEVYTVTAFTTGDTIGSIDMSIGLKREDRSTELDHDGFTTSAFVATAFNAAGETAVIRNGSTGAGALIGTTLANDGVIVVANTGHVSHQLDTGRAIVRVKGTWLKPAV